MSKPVSSTRGRCCEAPVVLTDPEDAMNKLVVDAGPALACDRAGRRLDPLQRPRQQLQCERRTRRRRRPGPAHDRRRHLHASAEATVIGGRCRPRPRLALPDEVGLERAVGRPLGAVRCDAHRTVAVVRLAADRARRAARRERPPLSPVAVAASPGRHRGRCDHRARRIEACRRTDALRRIVVGAWLVGAIADARPRAIGIALLAALVIVALPLQFAAIAALTHNVVALVAWIVVAKPSRRQVAMTVGLVAVMASRI